jgi:predicted esterase YcpF (UPF0227 family)
MKKFIFNHNAHKVCDSIGYTQEEFDAVKTKSAVIVKEFLANTESTQSLLIERLQKEMSPEELIILAAQHLRNIILKHISEMAMKEALGGFLVEKLGEIGKMPEKRPNPLQDFFDMMAKDLQDGEIVPEAKA